MEEFIKNNYIFILASINLMSAIAGLLTWTKYKHTSIRYFIIFLFSILICFILSLYTYLVYYGQLAFLRGTRFQRNYWFMTLYWEIGSPLFFIFFYRKLLKTPSFKRVLKYLGVIFIISCSLIIGLDFDLFFTGFIPIISVLGTLIVCACVVLCFYEILTSDKILVFYKSIEFYISASIMMWYLLTTPIEFFNVYFSDSDWDYIVLQSTYFLIANFLLYGTLSFALFYCDPPKDESI